MCGIVGALSWDTSFKLSEAYLTTLRDTMTHRGPDGAGVWLDGSKKIGFGHRRLSIVDLSAAGHQPMSDDSGQVVLCYNGEIYNHKDLRAELDATGKYTWRGTSDTEVLLNAYLEWGMLALDKLRGMFAFALWDGRQKKLYLVRDRVGIKPLYYSFHNNRLTFASEIKALLADPDQPRAMDEDAFFHYLSFLTTPPPRTMFAGISKLAAGQYMEVSPDGTHSIHTWWDPLEHTVPLPESGIETITEATCAQAVQNTLRDSVRLRKAADVPVGAFLSGGMDSSAICSLFHETEQTEATADMPAKPVKTFSIGPDDNTYASMQSELPYARILSEHISSEHHEVLLTQEDFLNFLPAFIHLQDEPIADPSCVPLYFVAKAARDNGMVVVQSGEGADELFAGYEDWRKFVRLQQLNSLPLPNRVKRFGFNLLNKLGKGHRFYSEYLRRGSENLPVFWGGAEAFTHTEKQQLLGPVLKEKFKNRSSWEVIEPIWQKFEKFPQAKRGTLNWMSYLELHLRLPEQLLMRLDKMTMGTSIEGRVPFLDHNLVQLVLGIPQRIKYPGERRKHLLKRAVRGLIPDSLIDRKKQGLGMPLYDWFMGAYGYMAEEVLREFCQRTGYLNEQAVMRLWQQKRGQHVWYLLNAALWWKHFIAQEPLFEQNGAKPEIKKAA